MGFGRNKFLECFPEFWVGILRSWNASSRLFNSKYCNSDDQYIVLVRKFVVFSSFFSHSILSSCNKDRKERSLKLCRKIVLFYHIFLRPIYHCAIENNVVFFCNDEIFFQCQVPFFVNLIAQKYRNCCFHFSAIHSERDFP